MFIPGFITQLMIIIILLIDCFVLYIGNWSEADKVYNALMPGLIGCLFLNFWFVTYSHFKDVWSSRQRIMAQEAIDNNV